MEVSEVSRMGAGQVLLMIKVHASLRTSAGVDVQLTM